MEAFGITHMWYTGIIEHATMTAYPGIPADDADVVKGRAGSPYAIRDYYDVDPDLATSPEKRMQEWESLIKRTHNAGMKVVMDFIPNHVARSYKSDAKPAGVADLGADDDLSKTFAPNNNFYYLPGQSFVVPKQSNPLGDAIAPGEDGKFTENPAKATGNDVFSATPSLDDWFETCKLNYGWEYTGGKQVPHFSPIPNTWIKMRDILIYWAKKDVDAFRCDVAYMVPVEFWAWCIPEVKRVRPGITFIAEIYDPNLYHTYVQIGKFDYLYDKVGLYDRLRELMAGGGSTGKLDYIWQQDSRGIERNMCRFLENHDEQRIASPQFAGNAKTGIPGMTVTALLNKGPVMVYFGQEVGEPGGGAEGFGSADGRTSIFDYWGVPEHQKWLNNGLFDGGKLSKDQQELRAFYKKLMLLSRSNTAIRIGDFYGLHFANERGQGAGYDDQKCYTFLRYQGEERVLVVVNFDREKAHDATLKIPEAALKTLGLPTTGQLRFTDQLLTKTELAVDAAALYAPTATAGLKVGLPPLSAFVFRITAK
jgi:glycosidase